MEPFPHEILNIINIIKTKAVLLKICIFFLSFILWCYPVATPSYAIPAGNSKFEIRY